MHPPRLATPRGLLASIDAGSYSTETGTVIPSPEGADPELAGAPTERDPNAIAPPDDPAPPDLSRDPG